MAVRLNLRDVIDLTVASAVMTSSFRSVAVDILLAAVLMAISEKLDGRAFGVTVSLTW